MRQSFYIATVSNVKMSVSDENEVTGGKISTEILARLTLEDEILTISRAGNGSPDDDFMPSIADQQKVGFFRQDKATQTEESEIVELKTMTKVLQLLLQESKNLKRELQVAKQVIIADYENKLQEKALDMYTRINERVDQLERAHEKRIQVVRRSYRQQLSDAVAKLNNDWKKFNNLKLSKEKRRNAGRNAEQEEEYKQLQMQISQQENIIQMLKMQLEQQAQDVRSEPSTPSAVYEVEHLRDELGGLQNKIDNLEMALDAKEEQTEELNRDVQRLNRELEKEKVQVKQLLAELEDAQSTAAQEIASLKRMADKQRIQMERDAQDKLKKARDEMLSIAKQNAAERERQERENQKLLEEQKKAAAKLQAKERAQRANAAKSDEELSKMARTERNLRMEVNRLKRELAKTTKLWEKKFAILQKSLYAIKDESYLRQTLQKQAAALHRVSVSYAADRPVGMLSEAETPRPNSKRSFPLPGIARSGTKSRNRELSPFTVSPPPGRGTEMFSVAESQIVDANEYIDPETEAILPLPSPPPLSPRWDDSRPSTSNHLLVVS